MQLATKLFLEPDVWKNTNCQGTSARSHELERFQSVVAFDSVVCWIRKAMLLTEWKLTSVLELVSSKLLRLSVCCCCTNRCLKRIQPMSVHVSEVGHPSTRAAVWLVLQVLQHSVSRKTFLLKGGEINGESLKAERHFMFWKRSAIPCPIHFVAVGRVGESLSRQVYRVFWFTTNGTLPLWSLWQLFVIFFFFFQQNLFLAEFLKIDYQIAQLFVVLSFIPRQNLATLKSCSHFVPRGDMCLYLSLLVISRLLSQAKHNLEVHTVGKREREGGGTIFMYVPHSGFTCHCRK